MKSLPNFDFKVGGEATDQFLSLGLKNFHAAVEYIWRLPYGRNSYRADFNLVLKENRGTCATKHALLAQLAFEQSQRIFLMLGIFEMNARNTPEISAVLSEFGLESLPEAHCYLSFQNERIDVTRIINNEVAEPIENYFFEERIQPNQIGDYKIARHRKFFQDWMRERYLEGRFCFDELWRIREKCIAALAQN